SCLQPPARSTLCPYTTLFRSCATGAEPYSVAIILNELDALHRAEILATDVDAVVLKRAREGVYPPNEVKSLPQELLEKYFLEERDRKSTRLNSSHVKISYAVF